jgi:hypothetical protein
MRTLFPKGYKDKQQRWRMTAWACGVAAVLLTSLVLLDDVISWQSSGVLAAAVTAGLAIFAGRWAYRRRQQDVTRNLKDSALW